MAEIDSLINCVENNQAAGIPVDDTKISIIGDVLNDEKSSLALRFRALFSLKNVNGPLAVQAIGRAFKDPSALLKHELAYCLGQMKHKDAIPILTGVLTDMSQEPIVRHEAAEAIGAIGDLDSTDLLKKYLNDENKEVRETCELSLSRLAWLKEGGDSSTNPYNSTDPAHPLKGENDVSKLKSILLDVNKSLFERYQAMFTLRDIGSVESALALADGLKADSSLFAHEVAFVLGQMQTEETTSALINCLEDKSRNEMIRHECAEALGAIGNKECYDILRKYLEDESRVVRESCEVALDMLEYSNKADEFQYALVP